MRKGILRSPDLQFYTYFTPYALLEVSGPERPQSRTDRLAPGDEVPVTDLGHRY